MSTTTLKTVGTATIETGTAGAQYLLVAIDGELRCIQINTHWLALYQGSVTVRDEATRLLAREAGYTPVGEWREVKPGVQAVEVAAVTGRCLTCVHGCGCAVDGRGCGHFGCWATTEAVANTCPGAAVAVAARRPSRRKARTRSSR